MTANATRPSRLSMTSSRSPLGATPPAAAADALASMLRDAALILKLDAASASQVAKTGALEIGGCSVVVTALPVPLEEGIVDNDVAIICPIDGLTVSNLAQAKLALTSNLPVLMALGCAFVGTPEDELQLVHATRLEHLSPKVLANKQARMAAIAGAMREDIAALARQPSAALAG